MHTRTTTTPTELGFACRSPSTCVGGCHPIPRFHPRADCTAQLSSLTPSSSRTALHPLFSLLCDRLLFPFSQFVVRAGARAHPSKENIYIYLFLRGLLAPNSTFSLLFPTTPAMPRYRLTTFTSFSSVSFFFGWRRREKGSKRARRRRRRGPRRSVRAFPWRRERRLPLPYAPPRTASTSRAVRTVALIRKTIRDKSPSLRKRSLTLKSDRERQTRAWNRESAGNTIGSEICTRRRSAWDWRSCVPLSDTARTRPAAREAYALVSGRSETDAPVTPTTQPTQFTRPPLRYARGPNCGMLGDFPAAGKILVSCLGPEWVNDGGSGGRAWTSRGRRTSCLRDVC